MMQLTYNEAFDPYHAVFRFLRLHLACDLSGNLPFDTLRILDFYLLFPFRLQAMKLFSSDTGWRKISKSYENQAPYGAMPDDSTIFARMEPFQRAAAASLVRSGQLDSDAWDLNEVRFTTDARAATVALRCSELNTQMKDVVDILCQIKARYPLGGRDGLKDRTGLLEYRYDSV
ncbi:ABC-three component system middle component 5 [Aminobacter sp. UC22_36]|uniref:ABC-three component system middle component 5 n=1 Tax=Aminobacter sp. UC22_36 TaxID=3374549 RepID=UPI0037568D88